MDRLEGRGVVMFSFVLAFVCGVSREDTDAAIVTVPRLVSRRRFIGGVPARVFYGETHQDFQNHTKIKLLPGGGRKVHRPPATRRMPRLDGLQVSKRAALDGEGPAQCIN